MNVPNLLTAGRIAAVPFMVLVYLLPFSLNHVCAAIIFALAALTDWFDGYLARYWQQTTKFGEVFDPVADKLIVAVSLVLLLGEMQLPGLTLPSLVIVGREIVISALREWMAELGKRTSVAVSFVGKFKTALQMLAITLLLLYKPGYYLGILYLGYILIYIAALLTLWSMFVYLKTAWPEFARASRG